MTGSAGCAIASCGVLKHDCRGVFRFAPQQGLVGQKILARHGITPVPLDTIYVVVQPGRSGERLLSKSSAAIYAAGKLGRAWKFAKLLEVLPQFLRDWAYGVIARHRYRLFGEYATCAAPDPVYKERFIDGRESDDVARTNVKSRSMR